MRVVVVVVVMRVARDRGESMVVDGSCFQAVVWCWTLGGALCLRGKVVAVI